MFIKVVKFVRFVKFIKLIKFIKFKKLNNCVKNTQLNLNILKYLNNLFL